MTRAKASVGVADHSGWAVLVTAMPDGAVVDRRRVELVDDELPRLPHHHEAQWALGRYLDVPWARPCSLEEALRLIELVRAAAARHAKDCLDVVAGAVPAKIAGIAMRACPKLPPTVMERISDQRAQTVADSVLYREALAEAAKARGWAVCWYDAKRVLAEAAEALRLDSLDGLLRETGKALGPPWQKDHKVAMAAAIVAGSRAGRVIAP